MHSELSSYYLFLFIDIDECASNNGGCPQNCTNYDGGFTCSCMRGYMATSGSCVGKDIKMLINNCT